MVNHIFYNIGSLVTGQKWFLLDAPLYIIVTFEPTMQF